MHRIWPSGVYFYRMEAQTVSDEETGALGQKFTSVKKMMLVRLGRVSRPVHSRNFRTFTGQDRVPVLPDIAPPITCFLLASLYDIIGRIL